VLVKQGRRAGTGMVYGQTQKDRKEKDRPCKKTAELLQQFSGLPHFGKHSLICVPV